MLNIAGLLVDSLRHQTVAVSINKLQRTGRTEGVPFCAAEQHQAVSRPHAQGKVPQRLIKRQRKARELLNPKCMPPYSQKPTNTIGLTRYHFKFDDVCQRYDFCFAFFCWILNKKSASLMWWGCSVDAESFNSRSAQKVSPFE
jgi:hypothetical protein